MESLGSAAEDTAEPEETAGEAEAPQPTMSEAMEQPEAAAAMPHPLESLLQVHCVACILDMQASILLPKEFCGAIGGPDCFASTLRGVTSSLVWILDAAALQHVSRAFIVCS